ncbi:type III pantothenate kinase [Luteimonas sp. e5]
MSRPHWLFDLGNSRLKFAPRSEPHAMRTLAHADEAAFNGLPPDVQGDVAWLAAVTPPQRWMPLLHVLRTRFARISFARSQARCGRLQLAYAEPARLGVDRFLALLQAAQARETALIVGVGTALTIDLIDAGGRHLGGRIAPSPTLMRESLHQRAGHLPARGGDWVEFADDTDDALASGCLGAALALIEHSHAAAGARLGRYPALWLHGGGAEALLSRLPQAQMRPHLVLQGLGAYADLAAQD